MKYRTAYVYGIFDGRLCLYVGQTVCPELRKFQHCCARLGKFSHSPVSFRILRSTNLKHVNRIEAQIMRAYWRRGEAKFSKVHNRDKVKKTKTPPFLVKISGFRKPFGSFYEAAKALNVHPSLITRNIGRPFAPSIRDVNGEYIGNGKPIIATILKNKAKR